MNEYCVVVANASRARFFSLEPVAVPEVMNRLRLVEHSDLVNPEATLPGRETWSDTRSGSNTAPGGGPSHRYDDHRERHMQEVGRRFARQVAGAALDMTRSRDAHCLVIVAARRMLGYLRPELETPAPHVEIREAPKDLTMLAPQDICDHLITAGVLPAH
jgi:protein required for attachment to host cells